MQLVFNRASPRRIAIDQFRLKSVQEAVHKAVRASGVTPTPQQASLSLVRIDTTNSNSSTSSHATRMFESKPIDTTPGKLFSNMPSTVITPINRASSIEGKESLSIMPPFMVSAPGKVIVFGKHAVVHGKVAIAAAISLRTYLHVSFPSKSNRTITLRFSDIQMEHTWNIDDLPWSSFSKSGKKNYYYDLVASLEPDFVAALHPFIEEVSLEAPKSVRKVHHASARSFLYLFLSLASQKVRPCVYTLRSTIPIGAGLGSSASISVCISTALLLQIRALSGPHQDQPLQEYELNIERINRWSFVGEMCIHGNPSGVDNTISSGGNAVLFHKKYEDKPPLVIPIHCFPKLPMLLVNTQQSRNTATEVAKKSIMNAIGEVTESAYKILMSSGFDPNSYASLKYIDELVTLNHGLLVALGVSHPRLERIREVIDHAGIGWKKLTGADGGGCAITILKSQSLGTTDSHGNGTHHHDTSSDRSDSIAADLDTSASIMSNNTELNYKVLGPLEARPQNDRFEMYDTTLAGDGVGVLWAAILHNANEEKSEIIIDQEKFLKAEGRVGIESLVGTMSMGQRDLRDVREGWIFWRRNMVHDVGN
ncbi:mevalonate kinase-like protein [Setomelanomma holmii]|uniref:Mevalonate kinase n=1 Tax=Setomelanomma holmii TaxID=210430 RepID=A0A9P4GTN6_9PLEO|nr:mevalonate kinase-like protein [Setomelanomma holmii]